MLIDTLDGIKVAARSIGGLGTTITLPEFDLTIDMGACTSQALRTDTVAFTHTHMDHVSGIPAYLGARSLFGMNRALLLVPAPAVPAVSTMVDALGAMQGRPFDAEIGAMRIGSDRRIGSDTYLHPFRVDHPVPGHGICLFRRVEKLDPAFKGLPGHEIAALKKDGRPGVFHVHDEPLVAVTGDSTAAGMDLEDPLVRKARILFVEATFLDDRRDAGYARRGGHAHLDELAERLEGVEADTIVLYHFSRIYKNVEIEAIARERLPGRLADRVRLLLPGEGERL